MEYDDDYSIWGNEILYRMCRDRICHDDIDTVSSKLWLIGRAYSAAIERKAGVSFSINDAARIFIDSDIDKHIEIISKINRLDATNAQALLEAHKYVTELLRRATGLEKRSLASKYLHFHSPSSVFIFDSLASKKVRELIRPYKQRFTVKEDKYQDKDYAGFVNRCLFYRDELLEPRLKKLVTPRRLDMELLGYGDFE